MTWPEMAKQAVRVSDWDSYYRTFVVAPRLGLLEYISLRPTEPIFQLQNWILARLGVSWEVTAKAIQLSLGGVLMALAARATRSILLGFVASAAVVLSFHYLSLTTVAIRQAEGVGCVGERGCLLSSSLLASSSRAMASVSALSRAF